MGEENTTFVRAHSTWWNVNSNNNSKYLVQCAHGGGRTRFISIILFLVSFCTISVHPIASRRWFHHFFFSFLNKMWNSHAYQVEMCVYCLRMRSVCIAYIRFTFHFIFFFGRIDFRYSVVVVAIWIAKCAMRQIWWQANRSAERISMKKQTLDPPKTKK